MGCAHSSESKKGAGGLASVVPVNCSSTTTGAAVQVKDHHLLEITEKIGSRALTSFRGASWESKLPVTNWEANAQASDKRWPNIVVDWSCVDLACSAAVDLLVGRSDEAVEKSNKRTPAETAAAILQDVRGRQSSDEPGSVREEEVFKVAWQSRKQNFFVLRERHIFFWFVLIKLVFVLLELWFKLVFLFCFLVRPKEISRHVVVVVESECLVPGKKCDNQSRQLHLAVRVASTNSDCTSETSEIGGTSSKGMVGKSKGLSGKQADSIGAGWGKGGKKGKLKGGKEKGGKFWTAK
eukprot:g5408.t1